MILIVAPRAGAWIEAFRVPEKAGAGMSLPVRERGLKLDDDMAHQPVETSLPVRERGLKRATVGTRRVRACRSPRGSDLCGLILS